MIQHRIQGIPCQIEVTSFYVQPALGRYCDSRDDCYGYEDIEYEIFDRKGYRAKWLENKMNKADHKECIEKIKEAA
jgi:hypothetical protein